MQRQVAQRGLSSGPAGAQKASMLVKPTPVRASGRPGRVARQVSGFFLRGSSSSVFEESFFFAPSILLAHWPQLARDN
jgi:hypothetical protein